MAFRQVLMRSLHTTRAMRMSAGAHDHEAGESDDIICSKYYTISTLHFINLSYVAFLKKVLFLSQKRVHYYQGY